MLGEDAALPDESDVLQMLEDVKCGSRKGIVARNETERINMMVAWNSRKVIKALEEKSENESGENRVAPLNTYTRAYFSHGRKPELFSSAESFLFRYAEDKDWDILLLDIEMGAIDSVTMAKRVRQSNEAVQIVFITGYSDYIAEGYEVAALHYLMKPVNREKLLTVLDRALEKRKQEERCRNLASCGEMVRIPFYEIRYLDVHQNYVTVHAKADYTVKRTLGDFEKELDDRFCRVGRAMILNLKYIQRVTKTEVRLSDGTVLPLPRGAYEPLNRAIIAHT